MSHSLIPTPQPNHLSSIPEADRTHLRISHGGAQGRTRGVRRAQAVVPEDRVVGVVVEVVVEDRVEHQDGRWASMM
jgi:hypothetical protein